MLMLSLRVCVRVRGPAAGTVAWMAPEILRAEGTYTSSVDVYSMGMVIFEALTGEYPFEGLHLGQLTLKVAMEGRRPQLWMPASEGEKMMQQIMTRCWAQEPTDRPDTKQLADDVNQALKAIEAEAAAGGASPGMHSF